MNAYAVPVLIYEVIQTVRARHPDRPALVGVAGAQGSGKTHWCNLLEAANRPRFAHFSLDDVYLTRAEREHRATLCGEIFIAHGVFGGPNLPRAERESMVTKTRPLYVTRGPPGTHDLSLAKGLIARLRHDVVTHLPRFDKAVDDRAAQSTWPAFQGPAEAILIDGWCMGALPTSDSPPLNDAERQDDAGVWRGDIQAELQSSYADFFHAFDAIVYLQAPSFEIVRRWRGQREEQTLGRPLTAAESAALDRFVMHYERVTRAMLAGHHSAKWIVHLDEERNVTRIDERG